MILATAHIQYASLWTQDADFRNLPNVKYFENPEIIPTLMTRN